MFYSWIFFINQTVQAQHRKTIWLIQKLQRAMESIVSAVFCINVDRAVNIPGLEVLKLFLMLNLAEHEILNAHKHEYIKNFSIFQAQKSLECYFSC